MKCTYCKQKYLKRDVTITYFDDACEKCCQKALSLAKQGFTYEQIVCQREDLPEPVQLELPYDNSSCDLPAQE